MIGVSPIASLEIAASGEAFGGRLDATFPALTGSFTGTIVNPPRLLGYFPALTGSFTGTIVPGPARFPELTGSFFGTIVRAIGINETLSEGLACSSAVSPDCIYRLADRLRLSEVISTANVLQLLADEALTVDDRIRTVAELLASSGFDLASTSAHSLDVLFVAAELLSATTGVGSTVTLAVRLAEWLVAREAVASVSAMTASEVVSLADALSAAIQARFTAPEALALADQIRFGLTVIVPEALSLDDTPIPSLAFLLRASETLAFIGRIDLPEGSFSAWVMNAETTGTTSYSNFPFNSLFTHQGKTYGVAEDGLYELTGDTDDGAPIEAYLRTGDIDFGISREKNVPRAYLYLLTDGQMILKTISSVRGSRTERIYELAAKSGDDEALRRVPLARGLRGVSWAFEVRNVAGADFDFSGAEVLPVVLSRRGS